MAFVVECRMPNHREDGPKMQRAMSRQAAIAQAREWIEKYRGEADIYDLSVSDSAPVMTHADIVAGMS